MKQFREGRGVNCKGKCGFCSHKSKFSLLENQIPAFWISASGAKEALFLIASEVSGKPPGSPGKIPASMPHLS